jgi:hypothetical protein
VEDKPKWLLCTHHAVDRRPPKSIRMTEGRAGNAATHPPTPRVLPHPLDVLRPVTAAPADPRTALPYLGRRTPLSAIPAAAPAATTPLDCDTRACLA